MVLAAAALLLAGCDAGGRATAGPTGSPAGPTGSPTGQASRPVATPAAPPPSPTPTPTHTTWGPSLDVWAEAGRIVDAMDLPTRAGQVIMAGYAGLEPPVGLVSELGLGGVILLGDNIPTGPDAAQEMRAITERLQAASGRSYPLAIAVDQEGGPVARLGAGVTELPPGMAHGAVDDPELSTAVAAGLGAQLRDLGFTMVFAPVADVTSGVGDPTIGVRSPGDRPDLVSRVAVAQVSGLWSAGVAPVLKHFPGHGSVPADSHEVLPVQQATREQLQARDLVPFAEAVRSGAPAVMVAHLDVRGVDPGVPSSVSAPVVSGMLRTDLGFDGLVVTDSLAMAGVAEQYPGAEAAVAALAAGSDLLLMPTDPRAARDAVVAAVEQGRVPAQRLADAARRVVVVQLHVARTTPAQPSEAAPAAAARELSARAVTLVSGPCSGPMVGQAVQVVGGTETDRARFTAAAERAGLQTGAGSVVTLLGTAGTAGGGDVVVALDAPHGLATSQASTARLALFGRTEASFDALVGVLTGAASATGTLPVSVPGVSPPAC